MTSGFAGADSRDVSGAMDRAVGMFQVMTESALDGMLLVDPRGVVLACNPAAARMFEYRPDEIAGNRIGILLPEPDRGRHGDDVRALLGNGPGRCSRETNGLRKDGSNFPIEISANEFVLDSCRCFLVVIRDIVCRRMVEGALQEAEQHLGDIAGNLPVVVFQRILTAGGTIYFPYISPRVRDLLGLEPKQMAAEPTVLLGMPHPEDRTRIESAVRQSAETLSAIDEEYRVVLNDGDVKWLRVVARPRALDNGDILWDGVALDMTQQRRATMRLQYLAFNDSLTGVLNRIGFHEQFERAKKGANRPGSILAVLTVGLDRFGRINDTLGHAAGDDALKAVARRLDDSVGRHHVLARSSGNSFAILLDDCYDTESVIDAVETVLDGFTEPFEVRGRHLEIRASAGISLYPKDGEDSETLLKNSGTALRRAQDARAGGYKFFADEMNSRAVRVLVLENSLRRGLTTDEFEPYFQPIIDVRNGMIVGMEALARWSHGRLGIVSPTEFIQVAEDAALIGDIWYRVLHAACAQNKGWQDAGLPTVPVAVNISGRQFGQPHKLLDQIDTILKETGLESRFLEVELTEGALMEGPAEAVEILKRLNNLGIVAAIDDFGTGYSSLSRLKQFPIGKLKIDRSFVLDLDERNNDATSIVVAVIAMAKAMALTVVAEGVENWVQFNYLRKAGCDHMQGYLFSPPLSAAEMGRLLQQSPRIVVNDPSKGGGFASAAAPAREPE